MAIKQVMHLARTYSDPSCWIKNIVWRLPRTVSDIDCIFVVGCPRSGTTLVQRILCTHSHLFSIQGETGLFSYQNIFHPNRKHFGLPQDVLEQLYGECSDTVDFFQKCVDVLATENNGNRFVEKTPQHVFYLPFLRKHFPKASILHIVRDGRDCFTSAKSHAGIPQNRSVARFARYWRACLRKVASTKGSDRVLTIRYEDLCDEPQSNMARIMEFLGLQLEEQQLDPHYIADDRRAAAPQFQRLNEAIGGASVGRWRKELTPAEVHQFERIAGDELRSYGYEIAS